MSWVWILQVKPRQRRGLQSLLLYSNTIVLSAHVLCRHHVNWNHNNRQILDQHRHYRKNLLTSSDVNRPGAAWHQRIRSSPLLSLPNSRWCYAKMINSKARIKVINMEENTVLVVNLFGHTRCFQIISELHGCCWCSHKTIHMQSCE